MDKKQRFAVEALVPKLLGDAVYQVICYYLKKDINEMRESVKVESLIVSDIDTLIRIKAHAFQEMMKTDKFRDVVLHSLNKVKKNKTDIVTTLLVQYELVATENATLMHDCLSKEFDAVVEFLKQSIKSSYYEPIYRIPQEETPSIQ